MSVKYCLRVPVFHFRSKVMYPAIAEHLVYIPIMLYHIHKWRELQCISASFRHADDDQWGGSWLVYPAAEDLYATSVLKIYAKIRFFKLISTKLHSPFDVLIDVLNTFCTSKLRPQRMIQLPFISLFMYYHSFIWSRQTTNYSTEREMDPPLDIRSERPSNNLEINILFKDVLSFASMNGDGSGTPSSLVGLLWTKTTSLTERSTEHQQPSVYAAQYKCLSCRKETALQRELVMELWDDILRKLYRSIFNHCDVIGQQSNWIRWKKRKIWATTPFKVIQGHRGRYQSKSPMRLPISD